ncbi:MAG: DUF2383 domain-containing protein [Oligoflexia bacterium]|nr:DUF2383 domain-containing protein [Oligoflexia bacterium]
MNKTKELIKALTSLAHLDIDAVHAYDQAIEKIDVDEVREKLIGFRADHERHVQALAPLIKDVGGEPPRFQRDFKGFLIQGITALRSVSGTEGALHAMKTNEELTNRTYDRALQWPLSAAAKIIVQRNRDDERRHLDYINQAIQDQVWKHSRAA